MNGTNNLLDIHLDQAHIDKKTHWELIKLAVRGSTIQYSARKKKSKNNQLDALQRKKKQVEKRLPDLPQTLIESEKVQLQRITNDINNILSDRAMGAVIRSCSKWEFMADRPSKYFLNLEKNNYCKKNIFRLQLEDGTITTHAPTILKEEENFYRKLYSSKGTIDTSYIQDLNVT